VTTLSCPASVLVVEDNDDIREAIGAILEGEGYEIALAENGERALELLAQLPRPCLLLVDLIMPQMDGWQLVHFLSRDDRLATIPVVVMSAATNATTMPMHPTLKKPIDLEILVDIVRDHCCGHREPSPPRDRIESVPPEY
jgi:two-component system, chemotaxis family, chemotaxis protein CheY